MGIIVWGLSSSSSMIGSSISGNKGA